MYEQERQQAIDLMILLSFTIFVIVLTGETCFLGWEMSAVVLLMLGLVASWVLHITGIVPESIRRWLYFILIMLSLFFYGIHETSVYDLALVMIVVIFVYSTTERYSMVYLCVATYYLIMCYDFVFVLGGFADLSSFEIVRIVLHLALVYIAGYLAKIIIDRHSRERKDTDNKIAGLQEANRRTEDFLTNVSHELRTPINAVTGLTAVMLKNEEDADKKKDIRSVQSAGHRLFGQIEDILDYTELATGRITVSEDTYMISSIINDIITGNQMLEREGAPELIFDIDARTPAVLLGDGRKIKKIIKHLTDNAIKFTKKGGACVRIYALQKEYGINLCIRVSDTGIGISEENLGKITEKFYQSNAGRNRRVGGLGLGLSIVYGMVAEMEGFIQIESAVGAGTTVSVSIPQKVADNSPCMELINKEDLCLACFLRPEKYEVPEVRTYYDDMISHMVRGLDVSLHRVYRIDELEKLNAVYQLTHLIIGKEEYEENESYFEALGKNIEVIAVADSGFALPKSSRIKLLKKPFYCLPLINILNAKVSESADVLSEKRMICPHVSVLVVDDEPMNLMVSEGIFKDYQMEVKTAESGIRAIELCEKEDFDLIFLDHMMPEMDGVETLKRLRKIHRETEREWTVIAFTANAVSGAREMFLQEGFAEFVSKPIEYMELERVLRKVLPKSSIRYVDEADARNLKGAREEEEKSEEDKLSRLAHAGFNTRSGIQYCRGDVEFYEELLIKFATDAERKAAEIEDSFKKEELGNYHILVHALKSSAKMVGADMLSEMARNAEEAAKNNDVAYTKTHHEELLGTYHEVAQRIFDALDSGGNAPEPEPEEGYPQVSAGELVCRLKQLGKVLDTFEEERAEAMILELSKGVFAGTPIGGLLRDVKQDVEDFEFRAAAGKLEALINRVEGGEV